MGAGIAEDLRAQRGEVVAVEVDGRGLENGQGHSSASRPAAPSAAARCRPRTPSRCTGGSPTRPTSPSCADCELVVEAVPEHLALKKQIFAALDDIVADGRDPRDEHVLAVGHRDRGGHQEPQARVWACTSSTRRPSCSSSRSSAPSSPTRRRLRDVKALAERLGKKPVVVGDKAGFIANALLFGYLNHAVSMYESKYATREDLDAAMRFGCGYPMGPLALLDLIGLDTAYEILDTMYKQGRERLHAPARSSSRWSTPG
jgi:3-hydroxybutyryl-CoA dehydrogenase